MKSLKEQDWCLQIFWKRWLKCAKRFDENHLNSAKRFDEKHWSVSYQHKLLTKFRTQIWWKRRARMGDGHARWRKKRNDCGLSRYLQSLLFIFMRFETAIWWKASSDRVHSNPLSLFSPSIVSKFFNLSRNPFNNLLWWKKTHSDSYVFKISSNSSKNVTVLNLMKKLLHPWFHEQIGSSFSWYKFDERIGPLFKLFFIKFNEWFG